MEIARRNLASWPGGFLALFPGQRKQQAFDRCLNGCFKSKGWKAILKTTSSKNESLMSIDVNLKEVDDDQGISTIDSW